MFVCTLQGFSGTRGNPVKFTAKKFAVHCFIGIFCSSFLLFCLRICQEGYNINKLKMQQKNIWIDWNANSSSNKYTFTNIFSKPFYYFFKIPKKFLSQMRQDSQEDTEFTKTLAIEFMTKDYRLHQMDFFFQKWRINWVHKSSSRFCNEAIKTYLHCKYRYTCEVYKTNSVWGPWRAL